MPDDDSDPHGLGAVIAAIIVFVVLVACASIAMRPDTELDEMFRAATEQRR